MWARTILLGGFSKAYAMTGWRIGYIAAPAEIAAGLVRIHQYSVMSAPTISQYAALEALRVCEPYVQEMREEYNRRRQLICSGLNAMGLKTSKPGGAFYVFPDVSSSVPSGIPVSGLCAVRTPQSTTALKSRWSACKPS